MNILYLSSTVFRIGTWYRYLPLGQALVRRGHRVTVINVSPTRRVVPEVEVLDGVKVIDVPRFFPWRWTGGASRLPWDIAYRSWRVLHEQFDVIHGFAPMLNTVGPLWLAHARSARTLTLADRDDLWGNGGLRGKARPLWSVEGVDDRFCYWLETEVGHHTDAVTVVSEDLRQRTIADGVSPERIHWLPNGCRVDVIQLGDREAARARLELPSDRKILLYMAVGTYDAAFLLRTIARLKAAGRPDLLTVFLGNEADAHRRTAKELGIEDMVDVRGYVASETIPYYLQASDLGLMPMADTPHNRSRWPIKVGDYLAAGLSVVTTDVGEIGRLVRESGAGIATAADEASFAAGIVKALEVPAEKRKAIARATAEASSWDRVGGDLEVLYRDLLTRKTGSLTR